MASRRQQMAARRQQDAVPRQLRGETLDLVACELVAVAELSAWREAPSAGDEAITTNGPIDGL